MAYCVRRLAVAACAGLAVCAATPAVAQPTAVAQSTDAVAVASFTNLSRNPVDDWIGGGITEAVTTDLWSLGVTVVDTATLQRALNVRAADTPPKK